MDDRAILNCIHGLVAEGHRLRDLREGGVLTEDAEMVRLEELERGIEQMWGLLRRRRALRAAGLDPDATEDPPEAPRPRVQAGC